MLHPVWIVEFIEDDDPVANAGTSPSTVTTLVALAAPDAVAAAADALEVDEPARDEDDGVEEEEAEEDCAAVGEAKKAQVRLRAVASDASRVMAGRASCTSGWKDGCGSLVG